MTGVVVGPPVSSGVARATPSSNVFVRPNPAPPVVSAAQQGPAGPPGPASDYGHIRYGEAAGSPVVALQPGVKTPFTFVVDPLQTQDFLKAPFAGVLSFDGTTITPRALGDGLFVEVNLFVTSTVAGGFLRIEIDVGSSLGPVNGLPTALTYPAGAQERVTFPPIFVQTLTGFMANGGKLFITATVPVALVSEAIVLIPHTAAPVS